MEHFNGNFNPKRTAISLAVISFTVFVGFPGQSPAVEGAGTSIGTLLADGIREDRESLQKVRDVFAELQKRRCPVRNLVYGEPSGATYLTFDATPDDSRDPEGVILIGGRTVVRDGDKYIVLKGTFAGRKGVFSLELTESADGLVTFGKMKFFPTKLGFFLGMDPIGSEAEPSHQLSCD